MEQKNSITKSNYNIFKELKLERKESIHSSMIVAIASHNLECRNLFFEMLKNVYHSEVESNIMHKNNNNIEGLTENLKKLEEAINSENYTRWINTEHRLKETVGNENRERGRADIWIGNRNKPSYRIIIENKIDAKDQSHQLRRYYRYLTGNERKNAGLFYLCLKKDEESHRKAIKSAEKFHQESKDIDTDYHILTYEHDIKNWLKDVLSVKDLEPGFKYAVEQYLEIVDLITQEEKPQ